MAEKPADDRKDSPEHQQHVPVEPLERAIDRLVPMTGTVAEDRLPAVLPTGWTERVYRFTAPTSGDLQLRFTRRDGGTGYAGPVYLFVARSDCQTITHEPQSIRNGDTFRPLCTTLANSLANDSCCLGVTGLTAPARVNGGQALNIFVYGLSQPADFPFTLTFEAGEGRCGI